MLFVLLCPKLMLSLLLINQSQTLKKWFRLSSILLTSILVYFADKLSKGRLYIELNHSLKGASYYLYIK